MIYINHRNVEYLHKVLRLFMIFLNVKGENADIKLTFYIVGEARPTGQATHTIIIDRKQFVSSSIEDLNAIVNRVVLGLTRNTFICSRWWFY